jgi:hypothetical protein
VDDDQQQQHPATVMVELTGMEIDVLWTSLRGNLSKLHKGLGSTRGDLRCCVEREIDYLDSLMSKLNAASERL